MTQKKICMLGSFAVGKTSLVSRFVRSMFSEKYLTTVGVKIDKKDMQCMGRPITLVLWDLAGEDEFERIRTSYLRGASGYLLVVDGTRRSTLEVAIEVQARVEKELGSIPFVMTFHKCDVRAQWEVTDEDIAAAKARGWMTIESSARTGEGVEPAFQMLCAAMLPAVA